MRMPNNLPKTTHKYVSCIDAALYLTDYLTFCSFFLFKLYTKNSSQMVKTKEIYIPIFRLRKPRTTGGLWLSTSVNQQHKLKISHDDPTFPLTCQRLGTIFALLLVFVVSTRPEFVNLWSITTYAYLVSTKILLFTRERSECEII